MKYYTKKLDKAFALLLRREYGLLFLKLPTYAQIFDRLTREYGIFIEIIPFFTFALKDHLGFSYIISNFDDAEPKLSREEWDGFASFDVCAQNAILRALEKQKNKKK